MVFLTLLLSKPHAVSSCKCLVSDNSAIYLVAENSGSQVCVNLSFKDTLVTENSGSQVCVNLSFKNILVTENGGSQVCVNLSFKDISVTEKQQ